MGIEIAVGQCYGLAAGPDDRSGRKGEILKGDRLLIGFSLGAIGLAVAIVLWGDAVTGRTRFRLRDPDGELVTERTLRGRWTLLYFGYTRCADSCPTTLANLVRARDELGGRSALVRNVFVTIDPAHDTPDRLRSYAAAFSPALLPLTGSAGDVAAAERAFGVAVHAEAGGADNGVIAHSDLVYVLDPRFKLRTTIAGTARPVAIEKTLDRLLD